MLVSNSKKILKEVNHRSNFVYAFAPPLEGTPLALNSKFTPRQQGQLKKAARSGPVKDYYVFGSCEQGQLGLGSLHQIVFTPKRIDGLEGCAVGSLSVGHNHCAATLSTGSGTLCWGYNGYGQLGHGNTTNCAIPQRIVNFDDHKVLDAVCGPLQTFVMTQNKKTGKSAVWHIGIAYPDTRSTNRFTVNSTVPMKVKKRVVLNDADVLKIAPAADFCIWIDSNNITYSFGLNGSHCALGQGIAEEIPIPTPISSLTNIKMVDAVTGWGHTIALSADGRLFSWGSNQHGQCGLGFASIGISEPAEITDLKGVNIIQIACGETHSMALDDQYNVYSWGSFSEGKLGFDAKSDICSPTKIQFFDSKNITKIRSGCDHSAALSGNGEVYVWGFGQHGALSMMSQFENSAIPIKIPSPRFIKIPEEEEIAKELEKLSKMNTKKTISEVGNFGPPNVPFHLNDPEYPFVENGKKIEEGEFFDKHYTHIIKDVHCGMDFTLMEVESTPKHMADKVNNKE